MVELCPQKMQYWNAKPWTGPQNCAVENVIS